MRKFLVMAAVMFTLGGCAEFKAISGTIALGTASVANPITPTREAQIEAAIDVAVGAMVKYRRACLRGAADVNCRQNIRLAQPYTEQLQALVVKLRRFSDENDQVNAGVIFQQIVPLYDSLKSIAATAGVNVGNLP